MSKIHRLLSIMARLRDPRDGCPWDQKQTFKTIAPYTIEEAYEVADAIERDNTAELAEELGDLLFQVVFHAQMAKEMNLFDFDDVVESVVTKMVRRHPHVFAGQSIESVAAQSAAWEAHKAAERRAKGVESDTGSDDPSLLNQVTRGLPAIKRALKLQEKAAEVAFDWANAEQVLEKLREEVAEAEAEIRENPQGEAVSQEIGDLLFTCVNLARHMGVDPESALRGANTRFERRFRRMEQVLVEEGRAWEETTPDELEAIWEQTKVEGS